MALAKQPVLMVKVSRACSPKNYLVPPFFIGHVLRPNGAYSGQKLMKLVKRNTPASTINTMPKVPVTVPVKYKIPITAAINALTIRSVLPMFFFMSFYFLVILF